MSDDEAFDLFFMNLTGWALHPGYLKSPEDRPTLAYCERIAEEMVEVRRRRCRG